MRPTVAGKPRLLFSSYHSYLDPGSGAALATRDLLELLTRHGWDCAVLCGPDVDTLAGTNPADVLRAENVAFQYRPGEIDGVPATLFHAIRGGVAVHAFAPARLDAKRPPSDVESRAFLGLFEQVRARFRPDVVLSYGGQALAGPMLHRARQRGAKVVFALHNFDYSDCPLFREVDAVLVPSEAARVHYAARGIDATVLYGPFNWQRVQCDASAGRHVTFVNPQPAKGAAWFARIAAEVGHLRPDVPFLAVEGRGSVGWLARGGIDPGQLGNVRLMPATSDPRRFYRLTRLLLVPSLCHEAFGRVAVEAMMNGIPVLASRRGGLPEALAGAGFLFDIPGRYTPQAGLTPTADEVAPWVQTSLRLYEDEPFYRAESERIRAAAQYWHPERLNPLFDRFFRALLGSGAARGPVESSTPG